MKSNRLLAAAALSAAFAAAPAAAQTVLKIGYSVPRDSHYGAGANVFCEEIEKNTSQYTTVDR